ncbi:LppA family lipoprotein [Mycolicibacterium sp. Dal123E01]|uniref:LppA family lipoprotein n=1 Tax=Mycolicibacterium sp. Dal123E01 TaxID=3457578 RepID=UPI00403E4D7E
MLAVVLTSCVKPTAFDPYAAPDKSELDRLQKIINDRPELEIAERQLTDLDGQIRAIIARHSPATVIGPAQPTASTNCVDPFSHNIGQTFGIEKIYARPAPSSGDWAEITTELDPILKAAGFRPNAPVDVARPPDGGAETRDDGTTIELINRAGNVLVYSYSSGCRLPVTWRSAPPPPDKRPLNDPTVHYPYLYGASGGRTQPAN